MLWTCVSSQIFFWTGGLTSNPSNRWSTPNFSFCSRSIFTAHSKTMSQSTEVAFCEFLAVYGKKYNEQKKKSLRRKTIDALVLLETTWLDMYIYKKKALWCGKRHFSLLFKKKKILRFHFWFLFERERGARALHFIPEAISNLGPLKGFGGPFSTKSRG